ncbi:MAG: hypothetical protein K8L99_20265 [Anaerolineae bacterium]|nr:hypothetical protein [Anaerolineae bacterium]
MRKLNPGMVVLSAGTVVLGGALLAACALVVLLLINFTSPGPSSPTRTPTRTVAPEATETDGEVDATATITAAVPSLPTLLPTLALTTQPEREPAEVVREYYELVSDEQLTTTWAMLSDDFKETFNCCGPDYDYDGYVDWWTSVDHVEMNNLRTVAQSTNRAVVYVELAYHMKAGGVSEDKEPYIELEYDPAQNAWLFDDKGPTETGRVN